MRRRPLFWLAVSVLCFIGAMYFWRLGNRWALEEKAAPPKNTTNRASAAAVAAGRVAGRTAPFHLLSEPGVLGSLPNLVSGSTNPPSRFANRLSNTTRPLGELVRSESALLLENALLDTALPISLPIPDHLRSQSDPGTYIVQSKGPLDETFRAQIRTLGGTIVAYVPNNAYLVELPYASAQALAGFPQTQTVLAYEPYYKLKPALLDLAVRQKNLPEETTLNVLLFKGNEPATRDELGKLGVEAVAEQPTPFGTMLRVKPPVDTLVAIAQLPGVQEVELGRKRVHANDLTRERNGVAIDSVVPDNYLGLSGSNVLVNINDTGVDANHPDLKGRVAFDVPLSGVDSSGHGTHVAGIIAGNGSNSTTVIDAQGSIMPPSAGQFRGMAPSAKLFSMLSDLEFGPFSSDTYLQERAARTNAFISNNSWHYFGDNEYDLAAASYDAAVRDALPGQTGSQGLLYVFAAGNAGNGNENGTGGQVDSIMSPATAKNVLTVGAIEQLRNITNDVYKCTTIYGVSNTVTCNTNKPWQQSTDSREEVASFSSRGNVGIGIEGDFGRFKPDVVAPGTFVVSTRSTEWDQAAYYNPTSHIYESHAFLLVPTNGLWSSPVFIPDNAVQLNISVFADIDLPIYVLKEPGIASKTNARAFTMINQVSTPPDGGALTPVGQNWNFSIGNPTNVPVFFDLLIDIVVTNDLGNYLDVLRSLNDQLGPYYRYESGTSMSAGSVSGTLALMQEFFQERLKITNSPALMKALLINGARSAGSLYDLQVQTSLNQQGWGLINLSNSIPNDLTNKTLTSSSLFYFDQSPTNALATGQKHTYNVSVTPDAQGLPMRVTVVWTDPPGNPVVSTKLVNDLDLVVTNLDNGDIFYGNDILSGNSSNLPWDTNAIPNVDVINNVENVYLSPNLGTNYSVTVIGKRVNVNAVTAHTNNVAQDYALVISSGAGELPGALTLTDNPLVTTNLANITALTNQFSASPGNAGGILQNQRTGANSPLLGLNQVVIANATPLMGPVSGSLTIGVTNQWHFYVVTNSTTYTNAAFLTFLPPTLSIPRMGVREFSIDNATRESDVDIFVSRDFNLTNLTTAAVNAADKSLGRGGSETLVYSNASPGIYYIGVKSESQEAAQYGFFGVFSELPFDSEDQFGNRTLRGINVPAVIPDGNPQVPGAVQIFAINTRPDMKVRRVVVTNVLTHELMGDLIGTLTHSSDRRFAVLNNHSTNRTVINQSFIYDDSGEGGIPGAQHSDGPGSLAAFRGKQAGAQWILTELDNAPGHLGTNVNFTVWLEKQQDLTEGTTVTILPGQCVTEFLDVFQGITNLTVYGNILSGVGPVSMTVCSDSGCKSTTLNSAPANTNQVTFDLTSNPLVNPGTYTVVLCNNGPDPVSVYLIAQTIYDLNGIVPTKFFSVGPMAIADDAVSTSSVFVTNDDRIVSVEVGLRVDHPRISDLVFHLVSPDGTRILLQENRGGDSASGMGSNLNTTNIVPVSSAGGPDASTNSVDTGQTSGSIQIDYNFFDVPDTMHIYYDGALIFDSGSVRGAGTFNVSFGPGTSTVLTIVMNEGGNPVPSTAWEYTLTASHSEYLYLTFTEDTNRTTTPIKFATPPFTDNGSPASTKVFLSGFEPSAAGNYSPPASLDGWTILSNQVRVVDDPSSAHTGNKYLALLKAGLDRALPTVAGKNYTLSWLSRSTNCTQFSNFKSIPNLTLVGSSAVTAAGDLRLTPASGGYNGTAWLKDKQSVASGFDTRFQFRFTGPFGGGGGDGITFTLQNNSGTDLNFGSPGASSSYVTVFFNTFWNWPNCTDYTQCDLSDNSVGIIVNNVYISQVDLYMKGINMKDGAVHEAHITHDGALMSVWLDNVLLLANIPVNLALALDNCGQSWVGFTAFTGAAWENHDLLNWSFCTQAPTPSAQILVANTPVKTISGTTSWNTNSLGFTAQQNGTDFKIVSPSCSSGLLLDTFELTQVGGARFVLPEQSLDALVGSQAFGNWTLEIWDNRVGPGGGTNAAPTLLGWELSFIFEHAVPKPIDIVHGVTQTNTVAPGQVQYFTVKVPYWASFATNWLIAASGPVSVLFNQTGPPTGNPGDVTLLSTTTQGIRTLDTNSAPLLIPGATYYLGISNAGLTTVTFDFEVDFDVTRLTNGLPVTGTDAAGAQPRYFYFDVTTNYTAVSFMLTNLSGNANLVVEKGLPFPSPTNYNYGSFNPGTFDEVINVFTNSDPVPLSPGRWYIGVFNADPGPVTYTIVAIGYTNAIPRIITLFNTIPYSNTNSGVAPATDYYRYSVSTNAAQVRFEILNPSADMTLVARKGLPLPNAGSYDYISANGGTTNELIIVTTNSTPVRLTPGDWFLSAIDVSGGPANYTIKATELTVPWTNITIVSSGLSNGQYCITWTSQPGNAYTVQGRTTIVAPGWDDIATVTATSDYTTYCIPLPSPYQYFQVVPAGSPSVSTNAPAISNITYSPTGVVLNWTGPTTARYQVQWSSTLPPVWNTFTGTVTSTTGNFTYTDDGSQSGGLTGPRYYRLILLP